jgi:spermidine/putrescine transport system ATP-binding protein
MRTIPPNERDTNLVFQHLSLFPHMSVGENVGYGLEKSGVDATDRESRVAEYLDLVDLEGYEDRNPNELSGGQQQRVALARALVNEPSVLLLDEPLASLDRKLRKQMQVELRTLHEKVEGSFFYVTHNQEVAMTLSDRMAVMNEGRLEQIGTPQEIYHEPATPFVADFIGDTNLLSGVAHHENGMTTVKVGGSDGFSLETSAAADGDVTVSIRPEDITLVDSAGTFTGEISERYFQGDQTLYTVEPDADLPDVQVVMQGRSSSVEQGEQASFRIGPDAPVVFE